jgi:hypothetical protein
MKRISLAVLFGLAVATASEHAAAAEPAGGTPTLTSSVISLDSNQWRLAVDPTNVGREQKWFEAPRAEAKATKVPWIIQDAFPGYHGVAWYWRDFDAPANPHAQGRYLLRFWAVDYKADVWLNGTRVGEHEGGEDPFVLDVTDAIKLARPNRLAVRVLNPTDAPIDGIGLNETPHRNKVNAYFAGASYNHGGVVDSVELLVVPAVRVEDVFARPDPKTGVIRIQATARNAGLKPVAGRFEWSVSPADGGATLAAGTLERELPVGDTPVEAQLLVEHPRLWELDDPFLYRVTVRVRAADCPSISEQSARCGFRDFRFADGYFRLNGRRVYVRCSHTGNHTPIGLQLAYDPDWLRRDLIHAKAMGFNMIRFIAGVATRDQLDLCDEMGLMVYEESYAGWCLADSPQMARRYDDSVLGMIRRDRNHPSIVQWGLLNETGDGAVFRHAAGSLPRVRQCDDSRLVMLNSGRFDLNNSNRIAGIEILRATEQDNPCTTFNQTKKAIRALGITWAPGQFALHPGPGGEYCVARWTAPKDDRVAVAAAFASIAEAATTDVHALGNGKALFDGGINVNGGGPTAKFEATIPVKRGDTIDFVVGYGNGSHGGDTTALDATLRASDGTAYNVAADFTAKRNPNGAWSFGRLPPGPKPDAAALALYPPNNDVAPPRIGTLSNPGSTEWEDVLDDEHPYQRVPHTAAIIHTLRTIGRAQTPLFLSEYGIGSAVDLMRVVRHYEQLGKAEVEDARFYRAQQDQFLADWKRWQLADTFDRPEDFFAACLAKMAGQRRLGLDAIRANPHIVAHSLTGTVDQGMTGEGLWTTFREFKPGTMDQVRDCFAPLRWCLFVEPVSVYRKTPVRLEAVLANEDALRPGKYPVRIEVVGPGATRVFRRDLTVTIADPHAKPEPPMVLPIFNEEVPIDGPTGTYRLLATFLEGAAPTGGQTEFYVTDPAGMPPVDTEVVLWGEDAGLAKWLADHGIKAKRWAEAKPDQRAVILVSTAPEPPGDAAAFAELARRIARGSTAVFLSPAVFKRGESPVGWLPLANKGSMAATPSWLYLKDEWAKRHPIFDGLPAGGLMDNVYYRELITDAVWSGQDPPAEAVAGAIKASQGYASGLMTTVYNLGAGRFVLNTLAIRENLGGHPAAERLLRNTLRWAASDVAKPAADLPADFDQQLKAMGY